jgi:hypothetical protein
MVWTRTFCVLQSDDGNLEVIQRVTRVEYSELKVRGTFAWVLVF